MTEIHIDKSSGLVSPAVHPCKVQPELLCQIKHEPDSAFNCAYETAKYCPFRVVKK